MAYMSCDPSRLTWDARAAIWDPQNTTTQHQQREQRLGAIWAWDTTKDRLPRKMFLSLPPSNYHPAPPADLHTSFHPLGLSVTVAHPYFLPNNLEAAASEAPALLVLVANHPRAHAPGVVDIFIHDLDGVGAKDSNVLRWIRRIEGEELRAYEDGDEKKKKGTQVNPFRIAVFDEQHSSNWPRAYPLPNQGGDASKAETEDEEEQGQADHARTHVRVPSFFLTSLPCPPPPSPSPSSSPNGPGAPSPRPSSSVFSSYKDFALSLLLPSRDKRLSTPSDQIWLYHASVSKTLPVHLDGGRIDGWTNFPPLLQTWDGNGEAGGSNSSASSLIVSNIEGERAGFGEWEQHWVRGISYGIKHHQVKEKDGEGKRWVNTYTPSFVSFWKGKADVPVRAMAMDRIGRVWTAGTVDTKGTEEWIEYRRNEKRRELGSSLYRPRPNPSRDSDEFDTPPLRPSTRIWQTTFLLRPLGSAPIHAWETSKLAQFKRDGIFVKKEYLSTPVFGQRAESQAEIEARSSEEVKSRGFLPTVPTAMAVDHEKGWVLVTGAYEERGVAVCEVPVGWAEV
ncbi:hypothetical protein ACQY0O_005605 [Thecaphora frezii]